MTTIHKPQYIFGIKPLPFTDFGQKLRAQSADINLHWVLCLYMSN